MARGQLFEYAVLHHPKPTLEQAQTGESPKTVVVQQPKLLLATTKEEVSILAARDLPVALIDKLNEIEILVRPF